jgi:hypothetical protein
MLGLQIEKIPCEETIRYQVPRGFPDVLQLYAGSRGSSCFEGQPATGLLCVSSGNKDLVEKPFGRCLDKADYNAFL